MTDLDKGGQKDSAAALQCEEGDLVIACMSSHSPPFPLR